MLTGHRLAIIAIGLALGAVTLWAVSYVGFQLGQQRGQAVHYARENAASTQKHISDTCGGLIGSALTICVTKAIEASREHERAEYDLNAQREMAEWSRWMFLATVVMAGITAVGVFFVWQTLLATQKMAGDTRDIGEKQVRAYVSIENIRAKPTVKEAYTKWIIRFDVVNSGQSPAREVYVRMEQTNGIKMSTTMGDIHGGGNKPGRIDFFQRPDETYFFGTDGSHIMISEPATIEYKHVFMEDSIEVENIRIEGAGRYALGCVIHSGFMREDNPKDG